MHLDLTNCDKEQIQHIEQIQPYGALLALDLDNTIIAFGASDEFDIQPAMVLNTPVHGLLKTDATTVLSMLGERLDPTRPLLIRSKTWRRWMTCIAHRQGEIKILELEFLPQKEIVIPAVHFVRDRKPTLHAYLQHIAENLRAETGYDRIMIYKFAPDWHGEVVAESLKEGAHSFMGHHFPASDIPLPARELFLANWVRIIYDVNATPIPIQNVSGTVLDLSRSILRSPSPTHLQYLQNMQVGASLTLSLIHEGRLWGLIACHHFKPKFLSPEERVVCALIAKLVSSRISAHIAGEAKKAIDRVSVFTGSLEKNMSDSQLAEFIRTNKAHLFKFIPCDGFCAINKNCTDLIRDGETPSLAELSMLIPHLEEYDVDLQHTEKLQNLAPDLAKITSAAGMLAIRLENSWIIWFRKEYRNSRLWAGNPNKAIHENEASHSLTPRHSFEAWSEEVKNACKHWDTAEIRAAELLRIEILRSLDGTRRIIQKPSGPHSEEAEALDLQINL